MPKQNGGPYELYDDERDDELGEEQPEEATSNWPASDEQQVEEEDQQVEVEPGPSRVSEISSGVGQAAEGTLQHIGGIWDSPTNPPSPTREANGDDLADLFKAPKPDDPDMQTDDLFEVSDEDVFGDGGEDMSDILDVSEEDIMGEPSPPPRLRRVRRIVRIPRQYLPPTGLRGVQ